MSASFDVCNVCVCVLTFVICHYVNDVEVGDDVCNLQLIGGLCSCVRFRACGCGGVGELLKVELPLEKFGEKSFVCEQAHLAW